MDERALRAAVEAWIAADPDDETRAEASALLGRSSVAEMSDQFGHRLQFGTAGLRGALGAGPNRMNRLVVRQAAAGLVQYLLDTVPDAATRGVAIGCDARHGSAAFAMETARVCAARGVRALLLPPQRPTPVLAWSITDLGVAGAVMVTASHNPPKDNGYKVYLGDGAQIVPPHDGEISRRIDEAGLDIAVSAPDDPLIEQVGMEIVDRYLDAVPGVRRAPSVPGVTVVATALHGVGGDTLAAAFRRSGFEAPAVVAEQQAPDPDFPTVPFPNPEEPGAMDLLLALARDRRADIALANDPDADRLGAAIPIRGGGWRRLSGDELGWLLADHILERTSGDDRLVVTTLVSSSMLARMATAHGVHHRETYTGFKWIGRMVLDHPELRFVFGYEQALGYLVARRPLDKDGITAAVLAAEVAACAVAEGITVEDRLDSIRQRYGQFVTAERSIRMDPADAAARVDAMTAHPPSRIGGHAVTGVENFEAAGLLRLWCGGARLQVRPSGTEPKVKLYAEAEGLDPGPLLDALGNLLTGG